MNFINDLNGKFRFLLYLILISVVTLLFAFWTGGVVPTVVITILIMFILWISKPIWLPQGYGNTLIRSLSLTTALAVAGSSWLWENVVRDGLIRPLYSILQDLYPPLQKYPLHNGASVNIVLLFILIVIFIVNFFTRDKTVMKEHSTPLDKDFPEKNYGNKLSEFSVSLSDDIRRMDKESNWSEQFFIPLDAEVEFITKNKRRKKISNLLTALKKDQNSRTFLVLGDPGAGKSVALRKLSLELLKEVKRTNKVPIYINLKEWEFEYDHGNLPTTNELYQSLYNFVLKNLKDRLDLFCNEFLDNYYQRMLEHGRFFFVFDSFDEIPAILDVDESSEIIDRLSEAIYRFLAGAHQSRGILASRIYRRPSDKFQTKTILEIRPFSERKIIETFKNSIDFESQQIIRTLFKERQELVPIARNPFTSALISGYARDHLNKLPLNQSELYQNYIEKRLLLCSEKMKRKNLSVDQVIEAATEIAQTMFITPNLGLEIPLDKIKKELPTYDVEGVVDILSYARLGRLGRGDEKRFSFVHRRFNEYFVARKLILESNIYEYLEAIPTDSRWRDSLVLYCELVEPNIGKNVADYCWIEIDKIIKDKIDVNDNRYLRAMHCLRFLKEAFRSRTNILGDTQKGLADFINSKMEEKNLLVKKLAIETVGLLEDKDIDSTIIKALSTENDWISDNALKSCRHLPELSKELETKFKIYIDMINLFTFMKKRKDLLFSFKLSNGFLNVLKYCNWRIVDTFIFLLSILALHVFLYGFLIPMTLGSIISFTLFIAISKVSYIKLSSKIKYHHVVSLTRSMYFVTPMIYFFDLREGNVNVLPLIFQNTIIADFLMIFLMIITVPWYKIFFYVPYYLKEWTTKKIMTVISVVLLSIGWVLMLVYFIKNSLDILFQVFGIISAIVLLFFGGKGVYYFIKDYIALRKIKFSHASSSINRSVISEHFNSFNTRWGRLQYVKKIDVAKFNATGNWLEGTLPNKDNDEASTLLAKLEEKWLGLDR